MFPIEHQDKFDRLRRHFLSGLPAREAEIEDLTASLLEHGPSRPVLEQLHLATHKLAGICATYGLERLGVLAETAENLLEPTTDSKPCDARLNDILLATDLLSEEIGDVIAAA